MFTVLGITGQVGGSVATNLLAAGHDVRAVVRNAAKGSSWAAQGCDIAIADVQDAAALELAFQGTEGVFVMMPPIFDPTPGFPEAHKTIAALRTALLAARPPKIVCLSTIGAQVTRPNLLNQLHDMEESLAELPLPVAFLRPGWFMENSTWDVKPARETGVIPCFLHPLDKLFPMVATKDIGQFAAQLLREQWEDRRIVELEGPRRVSPNEIAATFGQELGRDVRMQLVPRDEWESIFRSQGMSNPTPRLQMLDGFNQGWIEFEGGEAGSHKGATSIEEVIALLVRQEAATS